MSNPLAAIFCVIASSLSPPKPPTPLNAAATLTFDVARAPPPGPAAQWTRDTQAKLDSLRQPVATAKRARNIILFIGDGMGLSTVTAARILDGQTKQLKGGGEENQLSFEAFPATALAKTYNVDLQVPESSGAMTAIMTRGRRTVLSVIIDKSQRCPPALDHYTVCFSRCHQTVIKLQSKCRLTLPQPAA